jgi:hypothetical protein
MQRPAIQTKGEKMMKRKAVYIIEKEVQEQPNRSLIEPKIKITLDKIEKWLSAKA